MPLAGRLLLLGLLGAIAAAVLGAGHIGHLTAVADRLADISAQIRIRLTVLLAAGIAQGAAGLGFEAILGAFTAGVHVRMLDPSPNWPTPVTDQAGNDQLRPADPGLSRRGRSAPQHSGCR
jgi:Kef-type K+ transport system membrane component KefB